MESLRNDLILTIYAKDVKRVVTFYERTLELSTLDASDDFICVGNEYLQIIVVQAPKHLVETLSISKPPRLREETPLKHSFLVRDLNHARDVAKANGGGTKPISQAWSWRGQLHLDGFDPEGNIVQFRVIERKSSKL